ncbi:tyrosine-type recombinase/integrase [Franconibacter helveticus 513]|uniref:tyrosine-type recombinase/integrase n=1 Tax=Franconibacter helveticus TaxID=357240 RepID=UPI0003F73EEB|nr:tyrosine-type recombinase/integrase [Franconibacter helveticus]MDU6923715.1 tyrosine-type recombinase/integrase [Franconibacter helveticus]
MAKAEALTPLEFWKIHEALLSHNTTYSDLWYFLYHAPLKIGDVLTLTYADIENGRIRADAKRGTRALALNEAALSVITKRRKRYPQDVYLFQSHSNRVKAQPKAITIIAFNAALRQAAAKVTTKNVSSQSARKTRAMQLLNQGADLEFISVMLNHHDAAYTRAWLGGDEEKIKAA